MKKLSISLISALLLTNVAFGWGGVGGGGSSSDDSGDENCTYNVQKDMNYTTIQAAIDDADNGALT